MNNKINEFIECLLPDDINQTKKESLKLEIKNHILDAIDFYEENGFSYEKSVEKALSDFCSDEKTKKKIKKNYRKLHSENSLATFFKKTILVCIPLSLIIHLILGYMINWGVCLHSIIQPLFFYLIFYAIDRNKIFKKKMRSIISVFLFIALLNLSWTSFIFSFGDKIEISTNNFSINLNDSALSYEYSVHWYNEKIEDYEYEYNYIEKNFMPTEFENFETVDIYYYSEQSVFHEPSATTYIFKYKNEPEFKKERNRISALYSYFENSITLSGFEFNYFAPPSTITHNNKTYSLDWEKPLYIIGFNEKTNQILLTIHYGEFFDYTSLDSPVYKKVIVDGEPCEMPFYETVDKSSVDETFYKDYCGLKYVIFFNFFLK